MSSQESSLPERRVLLCGLVYVESPPLARRPLVVRALGTEEIVAVDLDGNSEVVGHGPTGVGWSIGWLPDGRLLVTGGGLMGREPTGRWSRTPT